MKTVFITIFDVFQLKNFFYTEFYDVIKNKVKMVVVTSKSEDKKGFIESILKDNPNVTVEGVPIKRKINAFQFLFIWAKLASINTASGTSFFTQRAKAEGKLGKYLFYRFFNVFFSNSIGHKILRWLDDFILPAGEFQYLFDKYHPDLVFATNIISPIDERVLKEAKKNKVKSISNIKSWDSSTMKGFISVVPDFLIAQNDIQKREMVKYHQYHENRIRVLGNPGFDIYFKDEGLMSRDEFCKFAGLDPNKKIIFVNISAQVINPFPEDPIMYVDKWISESKIKLPAQILVSPRGKYGFSEELLSKCGNLVVHNIADKLEHGAKENYKFEKDEVYDLKNCLYHADAVISTASTIAVEATLVDSPSISLGFDFQPVNYWLGAEVRNYDEHFLPVRGSGGVRVANKQEHLIKLLNDYLADPSLDRENRLRTAKLQAQHLDDKSGKRVAEFLLSNL